MLAHHLISGYFPPHLTLLTLANTPRYLLTLKRGRAELLEVVAAHLSSRVRPVEAGVHAALQLQISARILYLQNLPLGKVTKKRNRDVRLPGFGEVRMQIL